MQATEFESRDGNYETAIARFVVGYNKSSRAQRGNAAFA